MKFKVWTDPKTNAHCLYLELENFEISSAPLDRFDRNLVNECMKSNKPSDMLLALECIIRRIEEQANQKT